MILPALVLAAFTALSAPGSLEALLGSCPADSLIVPLRRLESGRGDPQEQGEAAFLLGQLHYARGEYRPAAQAFLRAAARTDPARKPEARYWAGLSWLALREAAQSRALLEEVAAASGPRRADALLGVALAWEIAGRADRAYDVLEDLLEGVPGEAGPAALARRAALAAALHDADAARRARERLLRDYPGSLEAAEARLHGPAAAPGAPSGAVVVQIGAFSDLERARSLVASARDAGFKDAMLITRTQGGATIHTVRLGAFRRIEEARRAGERAAARLGVSYQVVETP